VQQFDFFGPEALYGRNSQRKTNASSNIKVTSALTYRRIKVGVTNFLVHQWIEKQLSLFFAADIEKLVLRWDKCLNVLGGCREIEITVM
jgi:hypothetical protein